MHPELIERLSRQTLLPQIGEEGRDRIAAARFLVIGAGGLGSPALQYLAASGAVRITVADGDEVSVSNLSRQLLHDESRLGMNIRRDDSVWRAELPSSEARPDELRPLERRHVVRAYADFMDSDDASLTIGPELMLKDEHNEWGKKSRPEENDPSVGLGMQFSLDF